jgi:hypothetical protein
VDCLEVVLLFLGGGVWITGGFLDNGLIAPGVGVVEVATRKKQHIFKLDCV